MARRVARVSGEKIKINRWNIIRQLIRLFSCLGLSLQRPFALSSSKSRDSPTPFVLTGLKTGIFDGIRFFFRTPNYRVLASKRPETNDSPSKVNEPNKRMKTILLLLFHEKKIKNQHKNSVLSDNSKGIGRIICKDESLIGCITHRSVLYFVFVHSICYGLDCKKKTGSGTKTFQIFGTETEIRTFISDKI